MCFCFCFLLPDFFLFSLFFVLPFFITLVFPSFFVFVFLLFFFPFPWYFCCGYFCSYPSSHIFLILLIFQSPSLVFLLLRQVVFFRTTPTPHSHTHPIPRVVSFTHFIPITTLPHSCRVNQCHLGADSLSYRRVLSGCIGLSKMSSCRVIVLSSGLIWLHLVCVSLSKASTCWVFHQVPLLGSLLVFFRVSRLPVIIVFCFGVVKVIMLGLSSVTCSVLPRTSALLASNQGLLLW